MNKKKIRPEFQILFEDETTFNGVSLNGHWKVLPDKKIKKLVYYFGNLRFLMENYSEYNHLVEHASTMNGQSKITKIVLMGRKEEGKTFILTFDLLKGNVTKDHKHRYNECGNMILSGWQEGVVDGQAKTSQV